MLLSTKMVLKQELLLMRWLQWCQLNVLGSCFLFPLRELIVEFYLNKSER